LDARGDERPGDIHRARKFVGLHADNADKTVPAIVFDQADEVLSLDACIGLVDGQNVDG